MSLLAAEKQTGYHPWAVGGELCEKQIYKSPLAEEIGPYMECVQFSYKAGFYRLPILGAE